MILPPTKVNCNLSLSDTAKPLHINNIMTSGFVNYNHQQLIDNQMLIFIELLVL